MRGGVGHIWAGMFSDPSSCVRLIGTDKISFSRGEYHLRKVRMAPASCNDIDLVCFRGGGKRDISIGLLLAPQGQSLFGSCRTV